jgi:hypothetical protein
MRRLGLFLLPLLGCVEQDPCFTPAGDERKCFAVDPTSGATESGESGTTDEGTEATTGTDTDESSGETGCGEACAWWDESWSRRVCVRVDNTGGPEALIDLPVLLLLDAGRIDYDAVAPDGKDIRVVDADGQTELAFEVDGWNADGVSSLWVRVPLIPADSNEEALCVYFGNPNAGDGQDAPGTWPAPYSAVWHLSPDLRDATSFDHDLIDYGSSAAPGAIQDARAFGGMGESVYGTAEPGLQIHDDLTVSAWARFDSLTMGAYANLIVAVGTSGETQAANYPWWLSRNENGRMRTYWEYADGLDVDVVSTVPTSADPSKWHEYAFVRDAVSMEVRFYVDGELLGDPVTFDTAPDGGADAWPTIGADAYDPDAYFINGAVDEVRVVAGTRTAGWLRASYNSEIDALVSYGPMESAP